MSKLKLIYVDGLPRYVVDTSDLQKLIDLKLFNVVVDSESYLKIEKANNERVTALLIDLQTTFTANEEARDAKVDEKVEDIDTLNNSVFTYSSNIINPSKCTEGKYLNANSGGASNASGSTANNWVVTDYIPLNGNNVTTLHEAFVGGDVIATFCAYDENKKFTHSFVASTTGKQTFIYEDGDYYIRIGFTADSMKTAGATYAYACYGDSITEIVDYGKKDKIAINTESIKSIDTRVTELEDGVTIKKFEDVKNGEEKEYYDINSLTCSSKSEGIATQIAGIGQTRLAYFPDFSGIINHSTILYLRFYMKRISGAGDIFIWISDGRTSYNSQYAGVYSNKIPFDGSNWTLVEVEIDPAWVAVYMGYTLGNIWLAIRGTSSVSGEVQFKELSLYQKIGCESFVNMEGDSLSDVLSSADEQLTELNGKLGTTTLISPSSNKFLLSVTDSGELSAIPVIPNIGYFFGNSLLIGSGFGMAASEETKDYYYRVNAALKELNGDYTYSKSSATAFEGCTTESSANSAISSMVGNLSGNENLVVVQLGDNVNTADKLAIFQTSCKQLLKAIRNKCPKAIVVWFGMWYGSSEKYSIITTACNDTGCKFVSMNGLSTTANQSAIGNVQKLTTTGDRTLSNVSNVVENSTTNISVTFTVSNVEYTSTLDVNSYNLSDTTLTYNSQYSIITQSGVASHPGDNGFRLLANKFLYEMGYTDSEEYYTE